MPLNEKNPKWLNNDYIKFLSLALSKIENSGAGVIGYITSNSWLDGPTFRGVRTTFIDAMPLLRIINLHGNVSRKETAPDGTPDEGVFRINEGTNITIGATHANDSSVKQVDLLGCLGDGHNSGKFLWLESKSLKSGMERVLNPTLPFFELVPTIDGNKSEFYALPCVQEVFRISSVGFVTANDALTIHFSKEEIVAQLAVLKSIKFEQIEAEKAAKSEPEKWRIIYGFETHQPALIQKKEAQDWKLKWAVEDVNSNSKPNNKITQIKYRPFDNRWTFYSGKTRGFICRPRGGVMENLLNHDNLSLLTSRMTKGESFAHVHIASNPSDATCLSSTTSNISYVYPLWIKPSSGEVHSRPNINQEYARDFSGKINLTYEDGISRIEQSNMGDDYRTKKPEQVSIDEILWDGRGDLISTFGPHDLFDWIYAILHSPDYRSRYGEFLKSDFPRIPMPKGREIFQELTPLGTKLTALHLPETDEAQALSNPVVTFNGTGDALVAKGFPKYHNGKVMINPTRWFEDVTRDTWEFRVGGYRVCEKWLKDRAGKGGAKPTEGRVLTEEDILHYRRTVTALAETRRLMIEIDQKIEAHGGWSGAFVSTADGAEQEIEDFVLPDDLGVLPDGEWAVPQDLTMENLNQFAMIDAMRAAGNQVNASQIRMAVTLACYPAIAVAFMDDDLKAHWFRLIGQAVQPVQANVVSLAAYQQPDTDHAWGDVITLYRNSSALIESDVDVWSMGPKFPTNSGRSWMQGRMAIINGLLSEIDQAEAEQNIVTFIRSVEDGTANRTVS